MSRMQSSDQQFAPSVPFGVVDEEEEGYNPVCGCAKVPAAWCLVCEDCAACRPCEHHPVPVAVADPSARPFEQHRTGLAPGGAVSPSGVSEDAAPDRPHLS